MLALEPAPGSTLDINLAFHCLPKCKLSREKPVSWLPNPQQLQSEKMKILQIALTALFLLGSIQAYAAGTQYEIQVNGLACPFCAYSIEKKFSKIDGVQNVNVELEAGKVFVDTADGVQLTEPQMIKLFKEAGFTYKGFRATPL